MRSLLLWIGGLLWAAGYAASIPVSSARLAPAHPNDNTRPAGVVRGGALTLALEARAADWHPDGDAAPGAVMFAFAEEGGPATIPGPLLRVRAGTMVAVSVRNTLPDTLLVHGLHDRLVSGTSNISPLMVPPGVKRDVTIRLDAVGTYLYWGTTTRRAMNYRTGIDAQLTGAIVVDPVSGAISRDRVFVLGMWSDTVHRDGTKRKRVLGVVNGRSWPHTERLQQTVGDTVRWRVINATADLHPMHLHGFYFRVTSRGDGVRDTMYQPRGGDEGGNLAFTESMSTSATMTLTWVPERAGNWLFHCHVPEHFAARGSLGVEPTVATAHDHANGGMNGLVLGVTVRPRSANYQAVSTVASNGVSRERRMRLLVRPTVGSTDSVPLYAYALHEGREAEPPKDTGLVASSVLNLVRGQPVRITVVNRLSEATAVHWHGIELDSYFDGVPGFSGAGRQVTPLIAPNDSFVVRFTPPRSGTFMYHTHASEMRQQTAGLTGALIVRERNAAPDSVIDIPIMITSPLDFSMQRRRALLNGISNPPTYTMIVGRTYRLRLMQLSVPRAAVTPMLLHGEAGDTLAVWRPVAKDAVELPADERNAGPARSYIGVGETLDFEVTPTVTGAMRFELRFGLPRGVPMNRNVVTAATWPIRVVAADSSKGSRL